MIEKVFFLSFVMFFVTTGKVQYARKIYDKEIGDCEKWSRKK